MRALGYEKYRMYGTSGGGPFALAVAALVSQGEVIVTGIMAGSAPVEASRRGATYKRLWDEFVTTVFPWWRTMRMESAFSKANPNFKRDAIQVGHCQAKNNSERNKLATKEQYLRNGIKGYVQYWLAKNKYWGFELEAVGNKSPVHMVYGDRDSNTPLAGGRYMRERIGENCNLVVIPNTNHSTSQQRGARALLDKLATYK
jgi:pimeloyl-ACP methyl ester carboxylesterase